MAPGSDSSPLVAVTGGAGFIGSHTVDRLVEEGCGVVVLDDFSTGKRENLARWRGDDRVDVVACDVADGIFAPLAEVTRRRGAVERIVHLAAQVSVVRSVDSPLTDVRTNLAGTVAVLEYARRTGVKKVVFSSSAAVYGDTDALPVSEDAPCLPMSPYGIDKLSSEHYLRYYSETLGVPATALRFFNVYGPRQDPSSPYSGVISIFATRAAQNAAITVFGDGEQTRDFVYVGDVARVVAGACLSDAGDRVVANIGTGTEITINELARTIVELCDSSSTVSHAAARAGEIQRSVAAVARATDALGFTATTPLRDGLRETLNGVSSGSNR